MKKESSKALYERNQTLQKKKNILIVVGEFLRNPNLSMKELASLVNMTPSSVQRYLNDDYIKHSLGLDVYNQVQQYLQEHKKNRAQLGGRNFAKNNRALKDENGKFIGSVKEDSELNRNLKKENDIIRLVVFYLGNPTLSLQAIAESFNPPITRDYVYDCLTDDRVLTLFGEDIANQVKLQLEQNRYQLPKKGM